MSKYRLSGAKSTIEGGLGLVTNVDSESESATGLSLATLAFRLVFVSDLSGNRVLRVRRDLFH